MNILDIILLLCLIPALFSGLKKGFIAQVIAIIALVLGAWMACKFTLTVSGWLAGWLNTVPQIINIIAFILIFAAVVFGLSALGKLLEASIRIILLGWLNKLLGVLFSLIKWLLIIGLAIFAFDAVNAKLSIVSQQVLNDSVLYTAIKAFANTVFPYLKGLLFK